MLLKKKKYGFIDMITMSFKTSIFYSLIFAAKYIIEALLPTFTIFITADFIDSAVAVYNKESDISAIYIPVALLAGIMVYNAVINVIISAIDCKRNIYYRKKLDIEMTERCAELEYHYIENSKIVDLISRVCPVFDSTVWNMYIRILNILNFIIYIMGIMVSLFLQIWWVALTLFAASVVVLYIATKAGKASYKADKEMSIINRKVDYLSDVMKNREAVEERSVYGYTKFLNNQYDEKYNYARKFKLKVSRGNYIKFKMGSIVTILYVVIAILIMLMPVARGEINFSMFVALMSALFGLTGRLSWGVATHMEDFARKREYLRDLTEFMNLEENKDATEIPKKGMGFTKIEFKNVTFKYPGTDKLILDNISFIIEKGKHYSFVGVNGAGKTTITKLITGLYDNYEGQILIDGRSLSDFTQSEIKGLSSVVYQDFAKYYISLYDNIALANPGDINIHKRVEEAVKLTGLSETAAKLKYGLETPLGKIMENGVDLSGGEWQRTAMARSIVSNSPLKIFDEPTAALDPIGESMVYYSFEQIFKGMTTIFISHRLGSTKLADIIYVVSGGKIIESGSHSELMAKHGVYSEMFNSQAEWYKDTKISS